MTFIRDYLEEIDDMEVLEKIKKEPLLENAAKE